MAVQVGGDVDVDSLQVRHELALRQVAVVEAHVPSHAVLARQLYQVLAVTLALTAPYFRVRGAKDEVGRVGMLLDDLRHRLDDVFESLPGADQPESSEQVLFVQRA